jgi:protein-S-isoprenylcysteine O-methyltransferase Ste14
VSERDNAGVIAPPPLVFLAAILAGWGMEQVAPFGWLAGFAGPARWVIAAVVIVLGIGLMAAAITGFSRAGTAVQTRSPSTALVTTGVFSFARNPIYVGFFLILIGIAIAAALDWLLLFALVFLAIIHWGVVRREERYLTKKFGDAYTAYTRRVRRYGLF